MQIYQNHFHQPNLKDYDQYEIPINNFSSIPLVII